MGKNKKSRRKRIQPVIQGSPVPPPQPTERATAPLVIEEYKTQSDWTRMGIIILFFIVLVAVVLCYLVPLCFNAYFIVQNTPNENLNDYLHSIDRPLAWLSLFLAVVSLYRSRQSDKLAENAGKLIGDTHRLMQDMQSTVVELKWEIGAANTMLQKMYTTRSETPSTRSATSQSSTWEKDGIRKVDP